MVAGSPLTFEVSLLVLTRLDLNNASVAMRPCQSSIFIRPSKVCLEWARVCLPDPLLQAYVGVYHRIGDINFGSDWKSQEGGQRIHSPNGTALVQ